MLGQARETMGNHGFGNFRAGNHHWDRLGNHAVRIIGSGVQLIGDNFEGENHFANSLKMKVRTPLSYAYLGKNTVRDIR